MNSALLNVIARCLLATIFIAAGIGSFLTFHEPTLINASPGLRASPYLLVAASALEFFGGVGLLLGFRTRYAAASLIVVVAATIIFHAGIPSESILSPEHISDVLKYLAITGGLAKFLADGGGDFALDRNNRRIEIVL